MASDITTETFIVEETSNAVKLPFILLVVIYSRNIITVTVIAIVFKSTIKFNLD